MSSPAMLKAAFTLPAIPLPLGGEMARNEYAETVGGRIARLRREKGMTQIELAERLRVSQPVISDYENDVIRLPADTVAQIAEVLRASADELLGLRGLQASARHAAGSIKSRRLYRRMQEIEKLPRRNQEALLRTIEAFISKAS
jgi:transcriptional regulator with XRE-family HTH domain